MASRRRMLLKVIILGDKASSPLQTRPRRSCLNLDRPCSNIYARGLAPAFTAPCSNIYARGLAPAFTAPCSNIYARGLAPAFTAPAAPPTSPPSSPSPGCSQGGI